MGQLKEEVLNHKQKLLDHAFLARLDHAGFQVDWQPEIKEMMEEIKREKVKDRQTDYGRLIITKKPRPRDLMTASKSTRSDASLKQQRPRTEGMSRGGNQFRSLRKPE